MSDVSKLTIASGTYNIKDDTARTDISNMKNAGITTSYLADNAVTSDKLATDSVTNIKISDELNSRITDPLRKDRKVIVIGDSYGAENAGVWTGWVKEFKSLWGSNAYGDATGGAGWINASGGANFIQTLKRLESNTSIPYDEISDIIVLGGYNDMITKTANSAIIYAMNEFKTHCAEKYRYAKITTGFIGVDWNNSANMDECIYYAETVYPEACKEAGIIFAENFQHILKNRYTIFFSTTDANSGFHPSTTGDQVIADYLNRYLTSGHVDIDYYDTSKYATTVCSHNGIVTINGNGGNIGSFSTKDSLLNRVFTGNTWINAFDLTKIGFLFPSEAISPSGPVVIVDFNNAKTYYLTYRFYGNYLQFFDYAYGGSVTITDEMYILMPPVTLGLHEAF